MLTYIEPAVEQDDRAVYRPFGVTVAGIQSISPSFRRVTFTGPELAWFATHAQDQRIKLLLPLDGRLSDLGAGGDWYERWRSLPTAERNPLRTYTVRAVRPAEHELDVDFFVHEDHADGPAAVWLAAAAPGDPLMIVGPDVRSIHSAVGMDWHPGRARDVLIAGDETAAPAICGILETLPAGVRVQAFIHVPTSRDAAPLPDNDLVTVTWLARDTDPRTLDDVVRAWAAENRSAFTPALTLAAQELEDIDVDVDTLWDSPEVSHSDFYAWLAGEAGEIKGLRRLLVSELGIDRSRVAFMGYWRRGKAETQE